MQACDLYKDIAERTQGDVYIGVVGPVRTGKSTFITKFMEKLVIPGIDNAHIRARTQDELPQSGSGKTIMTTQPAFVPNEAVQIELTEGRSIRLRLIDSVGYWVPGALGTQEDGELRMVHTPWSSEEIPIDQAAEMGTKKVIGEHSTIGLVITTDGSVTDLPRESYAEAEMRIIQELQALSKPFAVVVNTQIPSSEKAAALCTEIENKYNVPAIAVNVAEIRHEDIVRILENVLNQFPVTKLTIQTPEWLTALHTEHELLTSLSSSLQNWHRTGFSLETSQHSLHRLPRIPISTISFREAWIRAKANASCRSICRMVCSTRSWPSNAGQKSKAMPTCFHCCKNW